MQISSFIFFPISEQKSQSNQNNKEANALDYLAEEINLHLISLLTTIISNSNSLPEPTPLSDSSEQMPNFNNLCQENVSKMTRVTDDLHQMVLLQSSNIRDLQNMMIGLLTIIGILIFFILKYRNGKQKRRRRSNHGKYRFNGIRSDNRYMNENSDAIDRSNGSYNGNAFNNNNTGGGMSFNACDTVKLSNQQTNFNQHTTNFIVCCLDSSNPMDM